MAEKKKAEKPTPNPDDVKALKARAEEILADHNAMDIISTIFSGSHTRYEPYTPDPTVNISPFAPLKNPKKIEEPKWGKTPDGQGSARK